MGVVTVEQIWSKVIRDGGFVLEHVKRMHHLDSAGFNISAAITCVLPMAHIVYIGDEDGKVVSDLFPPPAILHILIFILSTNGIAFNDTMAVDGGPSTLQRRIVSGRERCDVL